MNHLTEEQLILHYYKEADSSIHLGICDSCRNEYRRLALLLNTCNEYQVPERQTGYEQLIWQRISHKLVYKTPWWKRPWLLTPALASLLLGAFIAGRLSIHPSAPTSALISAQGSKRILFVALGDHLERSQMVLVELANTKPETNSDIHISQQRAQELVSENRIYRQTAAWEGDTEFAGVLDELERVLTDIANGPSHLSSPELEQIQQRIESRGLIFKIRVIGTNLQQQGTKQL